MKDLIDNGSATNQFFAGRPEQFKLNTSALLELGIKINPKEPIDPLLKHIVKIQMTRDEDYVPKHSEVFD